jgi:hypothetical protein
MRSSSSCLISLTLVALLSGGGWTAAARPGEEAPLPLGAPLEPEAVRPVGPTRLAGHDYGFERGFGESLERLLVLEEEGAASISYAKGGELELVSSYRLDPAGHMEAAITIGEDTLEILVRTDAGGEPELVLLEVNGMAGEIVPEDLEARAEAVSAGDARVESPIRNRFADSLRDPGGFRSVLGRYGDFLEEVHRHAWEGELPGLPPQAMTCCVWKCFLCAGSIFIYVKTVGTIVVGCGPGTVITLGGSCFVSILEHMYTSGMMVGACSRCLKCIEECFEPAPVSGRPGY